MSRLRIFLFLVLLLIAGCLPKRPEAKPVEIEAKPTKILVSMQQALMNVPKEITLSKSGKQLQATYGNKKLIVRFSFVHNDNEYTLAQAKQLFPQIEANINYSVSGNSYKFVPYILNAPNILNKDSYVRLLFSSDNINWDKVKYRGNRLVFYDKFSIDLADLVSSGYSLKRVSKNEVRIYNIHNRVDIVLDPSIKTELTTVGSNVNMSAYDGGITLGTWLNAQYYIPADDTSQSTATDLITGASTTYGDNTFLNTTQPKYGKAAFDFDGANDKATLTWAAAFNCSDPNTYNGSEFFWSSWMYPKNNIASKDQVAMQPDNQALIKFRNFDVYGYKIEIIQDAGNDYCTFASLDKVPNNDTWYHTVVVRRYDGTYMYTDGVPAENCTDDIGVLDPASSEWRTDHNYGADQHNLEDYTGLQDEMMWGCEALTADQVSTLYTSGARNAGGLHYNNMTNGSEVDWTYLIVDYWRTGDANLSAIHTSDDNSSWDNCPYNSYSNTLINCTIATSDTTTLYYKLTSVGGQEAPILYNVTGYYESTTPAAPTAPNITNIYNVLDGFIGVDLVEGGVLT